MSRAEGTLLSGRELESLLACRYFSEQLDCFFSVLLVRKLTPHSTVNSSLRRFATPESRFRASYSHARTTRVPDSRGSHNEALVLFMLGARSWPVLARTGCCERKSRERAREREREKAQLHHAALLQRSATARRDGSATREKDEAR